MSALFSNIAVKQSSRKGWALNMCNKCFALVLCLKNKSSGHFICAISAFALLRCLKQSSAHYFHLYQVLWFAVLSENKAVDISSVLQVLCFAGFAALSENKAVEISHVWQLLCFLICLKAKQWKCYLLYLKTSQLKYLFYTFRHISTFGRTVHKCMQR